MRCGQAGHQSFECKLQRSPSRVDVLQQDCLRHEFAPRRSWTRVRALVVGPQGGNPGTNNSAQPSTSHCRSRRHRRRRGGCRCQKKKHRADSSDESPPECPEPPTPPSPHSPTRRWNDLSEICFIDRTMDTEQWEAEYEYLAMLLQVTGTRPEISPQQALAAVAAQFGFQLDDGFKIHRAPPPNDFFLQVPNHGMVHSMLGGDRSVLGPGFQLKIRPWSRLVNAEPGALFHNVP